MRHCYFLWPLFILLLACGKEALTTPNAGPGRTYAPKKGPTLPTVSSTLNFEDDQYLSFTGKIDKIGSYNDEECYLFFVLHQDGYLPEPDLQKIKIYERQWQEGHFIQLPSPAKEIIYCAKKTKIAARLMVNSPKLDLREATATAGSFQAAGGLNDDSTEYGVTFCIKKSIDAATQTGVLTFCGVGRIIFGDFFWLRGLFGDTD